MLTHRSEVPALATILVALAGGQAIAQSPTSLPTPPNDVLLLVAESEASLSEREFGEAVEALQQLLDLGEDYFDPRAEGRSIKQHAERMLRLLPPDGRQAYQRRFGPEAETLLVEARRSDDDQKLDEVVRRFAMTRAGADALELLADRLWDRGDLLAAGRMYDRLVDHPAVGDAQRAAFYARSSVCWWGGGNETRARDRLTAWSHLAERSGLDLTGTFPIESADQAAVLDWMQHLLPQVPIARTAAAERIVTFRGDPLRSGVLDRAAPVGGVFWSYPAADEDDCWEPGRIAEVTSELDALEGRIRDRAGEDHSVIPAGIPVIAGNRVVFRGYGTLKWVDAEEGQPVWYSADRDETFKYLVEDSWRPVGEDWHADNLKLFFGQRAWRDLTSGAITCDDRYVYSIFHSGIVSAMGSSVQSIAGLAPHALAPRPYNLLQSYDLGLCTLKWEWGGAPGFGNSLEGVFFLGPPLAMDGLLYCLVDDRSQVRLVVIDPTLDPETEDVVVWEQSLYNPEYHLSSPQAVLRRLSGLSPSASGDVLICPIGEAALVAVDRRTRRLLWTFQYREISIDPRERAFAAQMLMRQPEPEQQILNDLLEDDHWCESAPVISGEYVIYTPPDHDELFCLRLTDGRLMWRRDRRDGLYVAGVYDGNVIVVGTSRIRAVRLSDGEPAWPAAIPIPAPSGRGFQHEHFYVLPLSSGEIASIDLRAARILTRSPTSGWAPGNLLSTRGRIYSQSAAGLVAFHSLQEQDQRIEDLLAQNPDDPRALALRGEQRLHLGDIPDGVSDLRRSLETDDDVRVREMLASTLIEGLRVDFANYRDAADEIDRLVDDPAQRATFLRLLADGLRRSGDILAAFETYLRFAGEEIREQLREGDGGQRLVQSDHWVRVRMDELYREADEPSRGLLDEVMAATVDEAVAAGDVDRLRDMLVMLPTTAQTWRWRLALVDQLTPQDSATEIELQLLELLASDDPDVRAAATARLLNLYLEQNVPCPIPTLVARLSGPDADRECLNGRTGAQLLEDWAGDGDRGKRLAPPDPWPTAHVEVDEDSVSLQPQLYAVEHLGPTSLTLRGWNFYVDATGTSLQAFDEQGLDRWRVPIGQVRRGQPGFASVRYVETLGRLVLLVANDAFFVLDALAEDGQQRVLVTNPLYENDERQNSLIRFQVRIAGRRLNPRGPLRNQVRTAMNNQTNGNVGPLRAGGLVYQQGSTIYDIDPLTGEEFWRRESPEVPPGAEIMADDEFVVLWPANRSHVLVLRAADGAIQSQSNLPPNVLDPQPDGDWGRCVVVEDLQGSSKARVLSLYDPVLQTRQWELPYDDVLDWTVVDGRDFGLLREEGLFTLVDGLTGEERFSQTLNDPLAKEISVERLDDQLLVMTASNAGARKRVQPWPEFNFPVVHGDVALLSLADGQMIWSHRVEHQTYLRHLPGRWPVLVFLAIVFDPGRANGQTYTTALVLSRDTGEVLHEQEWNRASDKYGWISRPDRHRLELRVGAGSIGFQFSEPPPEPEVETPM